MMSATVITTNERIAEFILERSESLCGPDRNLQSSYFNGEAVLETLGKW